MAADILGRIVFYLPKKRSGYVRVEGTREEFYFRAKDLCFERPLPGELIRFRIEKRKQGYFAAQITRASLA